MTRKIICQKCKYYFVTWQQHKPHGCHAYGFKSKLIPSLVITQTSGSYCCFYQPKQSTNWVK